MSEIFDIKQLREATIPRNYFIGVDTYDKDYMAYCLMMKLGEKQYILLSKTMSDKKRFDSDVRHLSEIFDAKIIKPL